MYPAGDRAATCQYQKEAGREPWTGASSVSKENHVIILVDTQIQVFVYTVPRAIVPMSLSCACCWKHLPDAMMCQLACLFV